MKIEKISEKNLTELSNLFLDLWPDCSFEEEFKNCKRILDSDKETCFLVQIRKKYIAFIYLNLRFDYVEGTNSSPVVYIEGIYVKPEFRNQGIGKILIEIGQSWGIENGCNEFASDAELHNEASIEFHKKVGFKEVNRSVNFSKEIK